MKLFPPAITTTDDVPFAVDCCSAGTLDDASVPHSEAVGPR